MPTGDRPYEAAILLLSDEPARLGEAVAQLRATGYQVIESAVEEAHAQAAEQRVDLVLLDLSLSDTTVQVARQLKADPTTAAVPILHLTASEQEALPLARGLEAGADTYLTKPVLPETLLSMVRGLVRMGRAYREAQRDRDRLAETLRQMPSGFILADREGKLLFTNARATEILGIAEIPQTHLERLRVTEPSFERVFQGLEGWPLWSAVSEGERTVAVKLELARGDGTRVVVRVNAGPIRDPAGNVIAGVLTFSDISDLEQAEAALRQLTEELEQRVADRTAELTTANEELEVVNEELRSANDDLQAAQEAIRGSEELLRAVVTSTDHLFAYLNADLCFVWANPALAAVVGRTVEEVVGRPFTEVFTRDEDLHSSMARVLASGGAVRFPSLPRRLGQGAQERWRHLAMALVPVRDAAGAVVGLVFSAHDVTTQTQQRNRLIAVERARAELAESLNKEMAHRTKNNLAMAAGLLQLQRMRQDDPQVSAALSETVTRLMAFASVQEEMQQATAEGWVDLLPVLRRVATASEGPSAAGEVVVSTSGDAVTLPSKAATNLAMVANELVTNAAKHGAPGPDGKLRVDVQLVREDRSLRLCVWNSGNPVADGFDATQQRGMGLQLVRDLVTGQYHGAVFVRPERGGTLVGLLIPLGELRAA